MSHDPLGILSMSSGSIGSLMRQSRQFLLYQCQDSWWIDKTQFHFWWFSRTGQWKNWQSCWQDYQQLRQQWCDSWRCSFQGETEVSWRGKSYTYSCQFDPTYPHWNGQSVIEGGLAKLGCIWRHNGMSQGYPPDEVIAACIGYVPLTATFDKQPNPGSFLGFDIVNWRYAYHPDFGQPETAVPVEPLPGHVYSKAHVDYGRIQNWEAEPRCQRLRQRLGTA